MTIFFFDKSPKLGQSVNLMIPADSYSTSRWKCHGHVEGQRPGFGSCDFTSVQKWLDRIGTQRKPIELCGPPQKGEKGQYDQSQEMG